MTKDLEIKKELDKLALDLASKAASDTTIFAEKLDAFKALTTYYLGISKANKKKNGESSDKQPKGETFNGYRQSVETSG